MKRIIRLLVYLGISCLLFFVAPGITESKNLARNYSDPKVVTIESTLGKSIAKIEEKLGKPEDESSCTISVELEKVNLALPGKAYFWIYEADTMPDYQLRYSLSVCTLENWAVVEKRDYRIREGSRRFHRTLRTRDDLMIKRILREEVPEDSEDISPPVSGELEFEI